ncbi:hypothetical protein Pfo_017743 [Paulownia fortunei]|nr:hypothetical protein Pfo_017743 [Paulownia fortunei]
MNHYQQLQQQSQQNMQMGSGLTRYRSAPSSYFASLLNNTTSDGGFGADDFEQLLNPRACSPETHRIFARFTNSADSTQENFSPNMTMQSQSQSQLNSQLLPPIKNEPEAEQPQQQLQRQQSNDYSSVSQIMYQSHNPEAANSAMDSSYNRLTGPINSNRGAQMKMEGGGGNPSLIRHSSSPAGLFANINTETEFGAMRGIGNFGAGNIANADASFSSASRFKSQMGFSSRNSSSSGMMSISEFESKGIRENNPGGGQFDEDRGNDGDYIPCFPWDDSTILSDDFLKGLVENDNETFSKANASDDQNNEGGNRSTTRLSHHLSLPKSSAMEKLLQDSVPCKIRAKRGCATHPRSIAERVRRTKISERMRKLQELVPNMEKQTNTADMLDLAVDYIKDLQRQVKTLSDNRANCSCSAKKKS